MLLAAFAALSLASVQEPAPPAPAQEAGAPTFRQAIGCAFTADRFTAMMDRAAQDRPDDASLPAISAEARQVKARAIERARTAQAAEALTPEQSDQIAREAARFVIELPSETFIETMSGCQAVFGTPGFAAGASASPAG